MQQPIEFKVEGTFKIAGVGHTVLVECITQDYSFDYHKPYLLSKVPGEIFAPMAAQDKQGNPRLHLYSFVLKNETDRIKFKEGDIVTLQTAPL